MRSLKKTLSSTIIHIEKQIAFEQYRPTLILGLLVNPLFIIRRNLYKKLQPYLVTLDGQVLDFGAGSAPYKNLTSSLRYVCLDFENEGHPNQNNKIDIYYDGDCIPFLDGSFDSIICTEVLEHVPNTEEIMRELCNEGSAIFFSTHVLEVAEKLCDKIAIIKDGKIVAEGTTEQVKGNNSLEEVFMEMNGDEISVTPTKE